MCLFFQTEVMFLGNLVNRDGISINPESRDTILKWPIPKKKRDVESFLGFSNYHRDHVKNFSPLYQLTKKKRKEPLNGNQSINQLLRIYKKISLLQQLWHLLIQKNNLYWIMILQKPPLALNFFKYMMKKNT